MIHYFYKMTNHIIHILYHYKKSNYHVHGLKEINIILFIYLFTAFKATLIKKNCLIVAKTKQIHFIHV